ncbi:MAG: chemotaxis protein CheX [Spirochaetota bacterium]|nr:chemotaxis protein CheX [Spirochaetota bacterium]
MNNYNRYYRCIVKSVNHIFHNFLQDDSIEEAFESQSTKKSQMVSIEIDGTISGELILNFPIKTINLLTKRFIPNANSRSTKKQRADVAGELANMITSSFANQLQFIKHDIHISAPEFDDDPIQVKALYENVNVSFTSRFGGFDLDLYYKKNKHKT